MGALSSMNIFLRQEIDRMQKVITLVRQTLQDLKLAIDGTIIMSEVSKMNADEPLAFQFSCFHEVIGEKLEGNPGFKPNKSMY